MSNNNSKVSIITAVYDSEKTVAQTILSIKAQTYSNIEHIIIEGKSTDNSLAVIRRLEHPKLKIFSEADLGLYDALNKGIQVSKGEIIGFVHSDDFLCDKDAIRKIADAFLDKDTEVVYSDIDYVLKTDYNFIIRHWTAGTFIKANLKKGWMPPHPTLYLRRSAYERYGVYDTHYKVSADYDLILRIFSKLEGKAVYISETLYKMRYGGISSTHLFRKMYEDYRALKSNKAGNVLTLLRKNLSKLNQFRFRRSSAKKVK